MAISTSALLGILTLLFSGFAELDEQMLVTAVTISGYGSTGFCCALIGNRAHLKFFSGIGMLISGIGFLITIGGIWELVSLEDSWQTIAIFIVLSAGLAHISLLLQIRPKSPIIKYLLYGTIFFISIVAFMSILWFINEFMASQLLYSLFGVFFILDILGTIITPILNKIVEKK